MSIIRSAFPVLWIPFALIIISRARDLTGIKRNIARFLAALALTRLCWQFGRILASNLHEMREWDFLCFWIWGKMGAAGIDFYTPYSGSVFADLKLSGSFIREILDTGFRYPPPTMLLLVPLASWTTKTALFIWYCLNLVAAFGATVVLWRLFATNSGILGLALVTTIVGALPPTQETFYFAQSNCLALLAFLLFWVDRNRSRGGLWIALGVVVKPYLIILLVLVALRRRWRQLVACVAATAGIYVAGIFAFGWRRTLEFFLENPNSKMPEWIYTEQANQSLSASILRATHVFGGPTNSVMFMFLSTGIGCITAYLVWSVREKSTEIAISLLLSFALVVYPFTLSHYGVMLLGPLFMIWTRRNELPAGRWTAAMFIALETVLFAVGRDFWAFTLAWGTLAYLAALSRRASSNSSQDFKEMHC